MEVHDHVQAGGYRLLEPCYVDMAGLDRRCELGEVVAQRGGARPVGRNDLHMASAPGAQTGRHRTGGSVGRGIEVGVEVSVEPRVRAAVEPRVRAAVEPRVRAAVEPRVSAAVQRSIEASFL